MVLAPRRSALPPLTRRGAGTLSLIVLTSLVLLLLASCVPSRLASVGQGGTSTLTRTLPSTSTANATIPVSLLLHLGSPTECSPANSACNDYYVLDERLPLGSNGTLLAPAKNCTFLTPTRLTCIVDANATSTNLTYALTLPDAYGDLFWTGTYMVQGDTTSNTIAGQTKLTLPLPTPTAPNTTTTTNPTTPPPTSTPAPSTWLQSLGGGPLALGVILLLILLYLATRKTR